jgi:fibronectin type 3 domain-containing protein
MVLIVSVLLATGMLVTGCDCDGDEGGDVGGLPAPSKLTAEAVSSTDIKISWTPVTGAAGYKVYRCSTPNGTYEPITTKDSFYTTKESSYTDKGLTPGTFYYRITAVDSSGMEGHPSDYCSATTSAPPQPLKPTAEGVSSTTIKISWTPVTGAAQYKVYRCSTPGGDYKYVATTGESSYTDTGLTPRSTYYYRIAAVDSSGTEGDPSDSCSAATSVPPQPSKPTAEGVSSTAIKISWTPVTGAAEYKVYRCLTPGGTYEYVDTTKESSYTDKGLTPGTFYYRITAVDSSGMEGPRSESAYAEPKTLSSITITTHPTKITYTVGENLNMAGLVITAAYSNGTTSNISDTSKFSATGFNSGTAAVNQTVTVSYTEDGVTKTTSFKVTINPPTLSSITITTQPTKTTYIVGESLNTAGMVVTAAYSDGATKVVTGYATDFNSSTAAANQPVTVSYTEGNVIKTATFKVTINPPTLSSITIATQPTKTTYTVGDSLNMAGLVITATYSNGTTSNISDTSKFIATGFNSSTAAANQTVTVSYTEGDVTKTATFTVTIIPAGVNKIFIIGYERETITLKDADGAPVNSITLSKTKEPSSITLRADDSFTGVKWYVDDAGTTGSSLILKASNYTVKTYSVTFTGWRNGSYLSSAPISLTVTN